MWPWEHAIMGYLIYSLFCHLYFRNAPTGLEAFAVVFASVLPDLIDKPLAWEFGVFQTGHAIGHSIFFAVPLTIAIGLIARNYGKPRAGLAFGLGYLLHLPADIIDEYVRRSGEIHVGIILWPISETESRGQHHGLSTEVFRHFSGYQHELLAGDFSLYLWLQFGMAVFVVLLWLYDGAPILREAVLGSIHLARRLTN